MIPTYKLRYTKRARKITLRICPLHGLKITAPKWVKEADILNVLQEKANWLAKNLSQQQVDTPKLPDKIHIASINQLWEVTYNQPKFAAMQQCLSLPLDSRDITQGKQIIVNWLKQQAKIILPPWLDRLACQHGFNYNKVSIRNQKTLWGSCNPQGNISLNYRMILLDAKLVRHLLLHELCHTKHFNHGPKFKSLLASLDLNARENDRDIGKAWSELPKLLQY